MEQLLLSEICHAENISRKQYQDCGNCRDSNRKVIVFFGKNCKNCGKYGCSHCVSRNYCINCTHNFKNCDGHFYAFVNYYPIDVSECNYRVICYHCSHIFCRWSNSCVMFYHSRHYCSRECKNKN